MKKGRLYRITKSFLLCVLAATMIFTVSCDTSNGNENNDDVKESYEVSDAYFSFSNFKCMTLSSIGVNGHSGSGTSYELHVKGTCTVSLYEYTISVKAYSAENSLVFEKTETKEVDVQANKEFNHSFEVTSAQKQQISRVETKYSGKSYDAPAGGKKATKKVSVTFMNGSVQVSKASVVIGETVSAPKNPTKTNYLFDAWYTDKNCTKEYDFSKKVTEDLTLYAGFVIDAVTLTNIITQDVMCGMVTVYNKMYNTQKILGIDTGKVTESVTSQGSGFIFRIQNGYCYIITNNHVIKGNSKYEHQELIVEDYQGKQYTAYLYSNSKASKSPARSAQYDLAFVYFQNPSSNLKRIPVATNDPQVGSDVISLGSPRNQANAIKYGKVQNYGKTTVSNMSQSESNVTFDVIHHTARTDSGSSGGPILDANLQVVGVHYAGNGTTGSAIPAKKLAEFLQTYVFNVNQ